MALGAARQAAAIVAEVTECTPEAVIADLDIMLGVRYAFLVSMISSPRQKTNADMAVLFYFI